MFHKTYSLRSNSAIPSSPQIIVFNDDESELISGFQAVYTIEQSYPNIKILPEINYNLLDIFVPYNEQFAKNNKHKNPYDQEKVKTSLKSIQEMKPEIQIPEDSQVSQINQDSEDSEDIQDSQYRINKQGVQIQNRNLRGKLKQSNKPQQKRNQYDKNIVGNIMATVLQKIKSEQYTQQLKFYCQKFNYTYQQFAQLIQSINYSTSKFGISQLSRMFKNRANNNHIHKVLGLFIIRFLREQYFWHILSNGKMSKKIKYLEYATKLMYVPKLNKEEYKILSQFKRREI